MGWLMYGLASTSLRRCVLCLHGTAGARDSLNDAGRAGGGHVLHGRRGIVGDSEYEPAEPMAGASDAVGSNDDLPQSDRLESAGNDDRAGSGNNKGVPSRDSRVSQNNITALT